MPEALLIVDFQNDFTSGGALPVPDGDMIAGRVNHLAAKDRFDLVVATRDWHPPDHASFRDEGGPWAPHCIQGSEGAELHPSLDRSNVDAVVDAGYRRDLEGYSGFEETELADLLQEHAIDAITVVGLATDYCVKQTAIDALRRGFNVTVDSDAVRGIDSRPGDSQRALREVEEAGGRLS